MGTNSRNSVFIFIFSQKRRRKRVETSPIATTTLLLSNWQIKGSCHATSSVNSCWFLPAIATTSSINNNHHHNNNNGGIKAAEKRTRVKSDVAATEPTAVNGIKPTPVLINHNRNRVNWITIGSWPMADYMTSSQPMMAFVETKWRPFLQTVVALFPSVFFSGGFLFFRFSYFLPLFFSSFLFIFCVMHSIILSLLRRFSSPLLVIDNRHHWLRSVTFQHFHYGRIRSQFHRIVTFIETIDSFPLIHDDLVAVFSMDNQLTRLWMQLLTVR